jgi:thioredoxin 1
MKKLVLLMILLSVMLFTAGCTDRRNSTSSEVGLGKNALVKITELEQINTSLKNGPVFVKTGSKWCPTCRSMKPILENLSAEYRGKATIASVDVDQNPELAEYFGVKTIPDSFVIMGIDNGTYVYMQENGNVSTDRSQARFTGLKDNIEDSEKAFENTLNQALLQQGKDKSQ